MKTKKEKFVPIRKFDIKKFKKEALTPHKKKSKKNEFSLRANIAHMEAGEVLRINDVKGREYMWDGTELYRIIPLKGMAKR